MQKKYQNTLSRILDKEMPFTPGEKQRKQLIA